MFAFWYVSPTLNLMTVTVPAATPSERRRARTRSSTLKATEQVFVKEGEEGLSIRRLAEAIDYSPAAIYKYFVSKNELIDELKEVFFAQILENARALKNHPGDFASRSRE